MVRRVRCPRCMAIVLADGQSVTCRACGLSGRVEAAEGAATSTRQARGRRRKGRQHRRQEQGHQEHGRLPAQGQVQAGARARAAPRRDPWTITIDLRNLLPSRWSPGAKAFSTLLMLAFVFFAGGVSGVVFERTRSDVIEDLDSGLFGSQDRQAGSPGDGGQDPQASDGAQDPQASDGDPGAQDPASEPGSGQGNDPGDDQGSADPDPDNGQEPAGGDMPAPQQFQGSGTWDSAAFSLPSGLVRFTMTHHGTDGSFAVKLVKQNASGPPAASVSASDFGAFTDMVRYARLAEAGSYHLGVIANGGGNWEVDVEIVGDEPPASGSFAFTGDGDAGFGPFRFNGEMHVTFESGTSFSFDVKAFRQDGSTIPGCTLRGSGTQSGTCSFAGETKVYFDIQTPSGDREWKFQATAVG